MCLLKYLPLRPLSLICAGEALLLARGAGEPGPQQPHHQDPHQGGAGGTGDLSEDVHPGQPQLQDDQEHEVAGDGLQPTAVEAGLLGWPGMVILYLGFCVC